MGARESTLEDIGILSVVVLPCGMLVEELFAGLLDELFGLRWVNTGLGFHSTGAPKDSFL